MILCSQSLRLYVFNFLELSLSVNVSMQVFHTVIYLNPKVTHYSDLTKPN